MTARVADTELPLLVVDDSDEDFAALEWALRRIGVARAVRRCATADELFAYLHRTGAYAPGGRDAPTPALILLDLNLLGDDGREVLAQVKRDSALRRIPVVVWTTSDRPADVELCYENGASGYAVKPVDVLQLVDALRALTSYWFGCVLLPEAGAGGARVPGARPHDGPPGAGGTHAR